MEYQGPADTPRVHSGSVGQLSPRLDAADPSLGGKPVKGILPVKSGTVPSRRHPPSGRWSNWFSLALPGTRIQGKCASRASVPLSLVLGLALWWLLSAVGWQPDFILPGPRLVAKRLIQAVLDGTLARHAAATMLEVALGLMIGSLFAMVFGYAIARSRVLDKALSPYLVASQAVPVVAIAPLLVIWFGPGLSSKVLICALIVFFPVLVNTVVGLRSVPSNLRDLMRSMRATRWQTLRHLDIPAALPVFLGGLRIGATLAVIGAVVGEFVGADRGLGFLINVARGQFDTALVFAAVLTLIAMALGMYGLVLLIERRMLKWQHK
jgi:NitT/TauT family transport system permease protein